MKPSGSWSNGTITVYGLHAAGVCGFDAPIGKRVGVLAVTGDYGRLTPVGCGGVVDPDVLLGGPVPAPAPAVAGEISTASPPPSVPPVSSTPYIDPYSRDDDAYWEPSAHPGRSTGFTGDDTPDRMPWPAVAISLGTGSLAVSLPLTAAYLWRRSRKRAPTDG